MTIGGARRVASGPIGSIDDHDTLTVQGDIYDGVAGEEVGITTVSPPGLVNVAKNAQLSGGNLLTRWQRKMNDGSDIQLLAYYDRVNRLQANQAEYRNTFDVDFVHHLAFTKRHDVIWGLEARLSPAKLPEIVPTYVFNPDQRTDQLYTAYAQDDISLVDSKLSLTVGAKLLHSSFVGFDVEPSARLLWTPTSNRTFWTAVTRAVRTPSDNEDTLETTTLRSTDPLAFSVITGDGRFTSETLIGYEAGYRSLITKTFSLDIAAFYNEYNHLQSLEPGDSLYRDRSGNSGNHLSIFQRQRRPGKNRRIRDCSRLETEALVAAGKLLFPSANEPSHGVLQHGHYNGPPG